MREDAKELRRPHITGETEEGVATIRKPEASHHICDGSPPPTATAPSEHLGIPSSLFIRLAEVADDSLVAIPAAVSISMPNHTVAHFDYHARLDLTHVFTASFTPDIHAASTPLKSPRE
jgi:hypothetical protein